MKVIAFFIGTIVGLLFYTSPVFVSAAFLDIKYTPSVLTFSNKLPGGTGVGFATSTPWYINCPIGYVFKELTVRMRCNTGGCSNSQELIVDGVSWGTQSLNQSYSDRTWTAPDGGLVCQGTEMGISAPVAYFSSVPYGLTLTAVTSDYSSSVLQYQTYFHTPAGAESTVPANIFYIFYGFLMGTNIPVSLSTSSNSGTSMSTSTLEYVLAPFAFAYGIILFLLAIITWFFITRRNKK